VHALFVNVRLDYCSLLSRTSMITKTRQTFDRALSSLPVTQHFEVWDMYTNWCKKVNIPDLCVAIFKRYTMFETSGNEEFLSYLLESKQFNQLVLSLTEVVSHSDSSFQFLVNAIQQLSSHADSVDNVTQLDLLIRACISHYPDEVGKLWCYLAEFNVRRGNFHKAYDIYEEAIESVLTVKDFIVIFESYVRIMESLVTQRMANSIDDDDVDFDLSKLEYLVDRRALYINSVHLRQNPNNVVEWIKRLKLVPDNRQKLLTFVEALKTINPKSAVGKFSSVWLELANFYIEKSDFVNARSVFERASNVHFKSINELAFVIASWAEFEITQNNLSRARDILLEKLKPNASEKSGSLSVNVRAWSLLLDIEQSIGTIDTCRSTYEKVFDLRIITVSMVLNYTAYLQRLSYFEESFQFYEKANKLFNFPEAKVLWLNYIKQFIGRYGQSKVERLRDMFEEVIGICPADEVAEFYILYANAEEQFGFERAAITLLDRALLNVSADQRFAMYVLLIRKINKFYGMTKTRTVYERAILDLDDTVSWLMCLDYADSERKLGEIDRARVILRYGSQLANPKQNRNYWDYWKEFEESHGNEDTFRDMLRIKRAVETAYSHVLVFL
jgi:pre-mRNA-splicing factor SYF1